MRNSKPTRREGRMTLVPLNRICRFCDWMDMWFGAAYLTRCNDCEYRGRDAMMETIHKRFSACLPRASSTSHAHCTGAYIGYQPGYGYQFTDAEAHEVTYRCNCPGHQSGQCGAVQGDFFKPNTIGEALRAEPKQLKLF